MRSTALLTGLPAAALLACSGCLSTTGGAGRASPPADFYVATNGNDAWSGTLPNPNDKATDGPFATLLRARDATRFGSRLDLPPLRREVAPSRPAPHTCPSGIAATLRR